MLVTLLVSNSGTETRDRQYWNILLMLVALAVSINGTATIEHKL